MGIGNGRGARYEVSSQETQQFNITCDVLGVGVLGDIGGHLLSHLVDVLLLQLAHGVAIEGLKVFYEKRSDRFKFRFPNTLLLLCEILKNRHAGR